MSRVGCRQSALRPVADTCSIDFFLPSNVRSIAALNESELKLAIDGSLKGSWHDEYKDSAVIFVGGLDPGLTEGDVITIFSQYGEILDINLPKWSSSSARPPRVDGKTVERSEREQREAEARVGKRRGFGFLLYEDQRSTILAVDNLNGAQVLQKTLRVDHVKDYKQLEKDQDTGKMREAEERHLNARPELEGGDDNKEVRDRDSATPEIDLEDPMASYIANQKKSGSSRFKSKAVEEAEKEAKRQRKEDRARIRAEREARKAQGGGGEGSSRPKSDARADRRSRSRSPARPASRRDESGSSREPPRDRERRDDRREPRYRDDRDRRSYDERDRGGYDDRRSHPDRDRRRYEDEERRRYPEPDRRR